MKKLTDLEKRQFVLFDDNTDELPNISQLPNGIYKALFYGWIFELENGIEYKTNVGIKRSRKQTDWQEYNVIDGNIEQYGRKN